MTEQRSELVKGIAAGAWARLRNLIGALDRVDRLETSTEFDGWLRTVTQDPNGLALIVDDFILRSLHVASDPINWRILERLRTERSLTIGELFGANGMGRVELVERLNELARAGLTIQELDGQRVESTEFAKHLMQFVDLVGQEVVGIAASDYLLNPLAKPSGPLVGQLHRRGKFRHRDP